MTGLLAIALLLAGAPLVPGCAARTKAIVTGRRGAPVGQLYADLWKLARRGIVYSTTGTWLSRLTPRVVVATTVIAALLLPLDGRAALLAFSGDAVAFVYLLALGRFALVLAALDTGSSFEGMGASREVTFASMVEPGLFIGLTALAVMSGAFSLTPMLGVAAAAAAVPSALVMIAVSVFALMLAECARVPVDDPTTHLELTMIHEVMVLDASGPDLAMLLYANALKLGLFTAIIVRLLVPAPLDAWATVATLLGGFVAVGVGIGIVESIVARLRMPKVPLYIAGASAPALFGLILVLR